MDPSLFKAAIKERPNRPILKTVVAKSLATYYGDEAIYEYIYPFSRIEEQAKLNWRRDRTIYHYRNFVKGITRRYLDGVFGKGEITRKTSIPEIDDYISKKYDRWAKRELYPFALVLPELFIKVIRRPKKAVVEMVAADQPDVDPAEIQLAAEDPTLKDEQDFYGVPVPCVVYPNYVRNFALDEDGDLEWIAIETKWDKNGNPTEFELYDDVNLTILNKNGKPLIEPAPHGFPSIPIKRVRWEENNRFQQQPPIGHSMMYSVIQLTIGCLQYASCLVEAAYIHLNLKIAMDSDTKRKVDETGIGNTEVLEMSGGPDAKNPFYLITPSTEFDKLIELYFHLCAEAIYDEARLVDRSSTKVQSGYAKLLDMVPELDVKQEISSFLYDIDFWILKTMIGGFKTKAKDPQVNYPTSFDNRTVADTLEEVKSLSDVAMKGDMPFSPTMAVQIMRQAFMQMCPDATEDQIRAMDTELKTWLDNYFTDQKRLEEIKQKSAAGQPNGSGISPLPELPASMEINQMAEAKAGAPPLPRRNQAAA